MMSDDKPAFIRVVWEIDDGYPNDRARTYTSEVPMLEFKEDFSDDDIEDLIDDSVNHHFGCMQTMIINMDDCIKLVKEHLKARRDES